MKASGKEVQEVSKLPQTSAFDMSPWIQWSTEPAMSRDGGREGRKKKIMKRIKILQLTHKKKSNQVLFFCPFLSASNHPNLHGAPSQCDLKARFLGSVIRWCAISLKGVVDIDLSVNKAPSRMGRRKPCK